jgi:hypothetical protein
MFPWFQQPKQPQTPREQLLVWLAEGVPPEDACEALALTWDVERHQPDVVQAAARGRVELFIRAKDSGVTGVIRAAMRVESKSWQPKAEPNLGLSLEDYLRD